MGRLNLYQIQPSALYDENVLEQEKIVVNKEDFESIIDFLSTSTLITEDRTCYIYGFGSQPKSVYRKLAQKSINDYDVIWYGFNGPKKLKFISYLTASTGGLIRIVNIQCVRFLLERLSHLSMVGLFSLSRPFAEYFESDVLDNIGNLNAAPEILIRKDNSFFSFVIDGDSYDDEKKGFLCKLAIGKNCPEDLLKIKMFSDKRW